MRHRTESDRAAVINSRPRPHILDAGDDAATLRGIAGILRRFKWPSRETAKDVGAMLYDLRIIADRLERNR